MKSKNLIEVFVNRQHRELVEDDDYFINSIEVNGKEIEDLDELEFIFNLPSLSVEDVMFAEELSEINNTTYKTKNAVYNLIVTDLDEGKFDQEEDYE